MVMMMMVMLDDDDGDDDDDCEDHDDDDGEDDRDDGNDDDDDDALREQQRWGLLLLGLGSGDFERKISGSRLWNSRECFEAERAKATCAFGNISGVTSTCFGLRVPCGHILSSRSIEQHTNETHVLFHRCLRKSAQVSRTLAPAARTSRPEPFSAWIWSSLVEQTAAPGAQGLTDWCRLFRADRENASFRYD